MVSTTGTASWRLRALQVATVTFLLGSVGAYIGSALQEEARGRVVWGFISGFSLLAASGFAMLWWRGHQSMGLEAAEAEAAAQTTWEQEMAELREQMARLTAGQQVPDQPGAAAAAHLPPPQGATQDPTLPPPPSNPPPLPPPSAGGQFQNFANWAGLPAGLPPAPPGFQQPPPAQNAAAPPALGGVGVSSMPPAAPNSVAAQDGACATMIKEALVHYSTGAGADPYWGQRFWQRVAAMEAQQMITSCVLALLRSQGYIGIQTLSPPRADLKAALERLEAAGTIGPLPGTAAGSAAPLLAPSAGGGTASSMARWTTSLTPDFRRAGPEIYRSMRGSGYLTARDWVSEEYVGSRSEPIWTTLWNAAVQIDFAAGQATTDEQLEVLLGTDDRLEVGLRYLSAHFFEQATKDKVAAARIRGITAPGSGVPMVPDWLLQDATVLSKSEYQRAERVRGEMKQRKGDKGKGKGKKGKGKEE